MRTRLSLVVVICAAMFVAYVHGQYGAPQQQRSIDALMNELQ